MIAIFAFSGPFGIGLGWILCNTNDVLTAVFMAISSGIFLYIGGVEIINEEFTVSRYKTIKLAFYFIGVALIITLWFVENN